VEPEYLNLEEAAQFLRLPSTRALRDLCKRRVISHIRVNRTHWLFQRQALEAWLNARTVLKK
jgi:excisionase family DNA binding protein